MDDRERRRLLGAAVGAIVGFALTFSFHAWATPRLEDRSDWLRDLQGVLSTTIVLGVAAGAVIGRVVVERRDRSRG